MIETVKSIFKYYIAYFIFASILSFIIAYFFIAPYMGNDKALGLKKDIDCSINFFIEKALILGKTDLVKEYINLRKKEMPECIY